MAPASGDNYWNKKKKKREKRKEKSTVSNGTSSYKYYGTYFYLLVEVMNEISNFLSKQKQSLIGAKINRL